MVKNIAFSQIPESDIVINYTIQRYKKGLGTTIFCIGLPGTGKSSVSMRLGELITKEIHKEREIDIHNIVDSLVGLLGFVRAVKGPGEVVVVEELSVLFPSRRAMAKDNVSIGKILDTLRKKQVILIANAPLLLGMDSHVRALGDILIETLRINKKEKVVVSKALRLQTNPRSGKTYLHRFQRDGREVHRIYTRMPDLKLWNEYEERKDKFLDDLYERLKFEAEAKDKKLLKEMGKIKVVRDLTAKELRAYHLVVVKKLTHEKAGEVMGVSRVRITAIMKNIAKKSSIPLENRQSNITNDTGETKS